MTCCSYKKCLKVQKSRVLNLQLKQTIANGPKITNAFCKDMTPCIKKHVDPFELNRADVQTKEADLCKHVVTNPIQA